MNWLMTAKTILSLLPAIIEAIKAIEAAIPGKGQGETKLAAVREILESVDAGAKDMWPIINTAITALVKMLNKSGEFETSK